MTNPLRTLGYLRVSTDEQAKDGSSLLSQRAKIEGYCTLHDMQLLQVFSDEGLSGKRTDNRPGLQAALKLLRSKQADVLVVYKLDRLSRATRDVLDIMEESGKSLWAVHSICEKLDTASPTGRFVVTILAGLAQMQREQIAERTRTALQDMKRRGMRTGNVPYGFDLIEDGKLSKHGNPCTLVPNAREQEVIREAKQMHADGHSLRSIARFLNHARVPTKKAKHWTHTRVTRIVKVG